MYLRKSRAISRAAAVVIAVVILVAAVAGIYFGFYYSSSSSTTSSSTTTSSSSTTTTSSSIFTTSSSTTTSSTSTSSTSVSVPKTLTYEWAETTEYIDPDVSYLSSDYNVMQNVYEALVFFNGTSPTSIVPWLAQTWTPNSAGTQIQVTLRSGITFPDGEPLNSTAVYFSLNRALVFDASTPTGHCSQGSWLVQQEVNQSLSCFFSGPQNYGKGYADAWLAQNFVQVTGPLTFTLNLKIPNPAFEAIMAQPPGYIMPPEFVMQHDLALWTQSSTGYNLPTPTLSGSLNNQIKQYLEDLSSTCNSGVTPSGCALTYLDHSVQGSMAGTGPYTISSVDLTNNIVTLQANPNYWGGPYQFTGAGQKITPQIKTVIFKFVPDVTTREIDLKNAASSGQAVAIDLPSTNLYDVADRASWLSTGTLKSDIPGVSMYGPYPQLAISFFPFNMNVSSPFNPSVEVPFQPFADLRIRLAFADAVNMTAEWNSVDNRIGEVAPNVVPPGLPPAGVFNASNGPIYSYNPDKAAQLLISAMQNPITHFTFTNGTAAPPGYFNNAFGCTSFPTGTTACANPIKQTITLTVADGYPVDESILNDMTSVLNNISLTYNMGLTVGVAREPFGTMVTQAFSPPSPLYMYDLGWFQDYPWVLDFTLNMFNYPGSYPGGMGTNLTAMNTLYHESITASQANNLPALIKYSNEMNQLANQRVMYLWEFDSVNYVTMTSNVQGLYWNSNAATAAFNGIGPEFFASLY